MRSVVPHSRNPIDFSDPLHYGPPASSILRLLLGLAVTQQLIAAQTTADAPAISPEQKHKYTDYNAAPLSLTARALHQGSQLSQGESSLSLSLSLSSVSIPRCCCTSLGSTFSCSSAVQLMLGNTLIMAYCRDLKPQPFLEPGGGLPVHEQECSTL